MPPNPIEYATYFRPRGLVGVEALHASFIGGHAYRPHSHPTWTVALVERGAARFSLDATQQRADEGDLSCWNPRPSIPPWPPNGPGWELTRRSCARLRRLHPTCAPSRRCECGVELSTPPCDGARQHLFDRWDQRVTLAELADVASLSRFELVRRFGAETGLTPHTYKVNLRVSRARALLVIGITPAAVAADCGFADQPHLARTFKRAVGVSPGPYTRAVVG